MSDEVIGEIGDTGNPLNPTPTDGVGGGVTLPEDPNAPGDIDVGIGETPIDFTDDEARKILQVRLMIGDSPGSPFYPLFEDEEIAQFLEMNNWNVRRATRMAAIAASMNFSQMVYRERTGDIEVWNNVSLQYLKALENIINEKTVSAFGTLVPYFGGIDWCVVEKYRTDPENVRSPLAKLGESSYDPMSGTILINVIKEGDNNVNYVPETGNINNSTF